MFSEKQTHQLLKPINPRRVLKDGKGHSHVSQQDVVAHLIRVFGFGNFDTEILDIQPLFENPRVKNGEPTGRYDVGYRATMRLTVRDETGKECHYENGSTATAQNQTLGDAHDLAFKSAISLAVKRCAIALGDGFGLSLYNSGQTKPLVMDTLIKPQDDEPLRNAETVYQDHPQGDIQDDVPQQTSLGNDEIEHPQDAATLGKRVD